MAQVHNSITPSGAATIRAPRQSQHMSRSPSRGHRYSEDTEELLYSLKPFCVVESLRSPIGALKKCLDEASGSEQSFAMRAAITSKHIHDWYEELSEWPWPRGGGSAGFEPQSPEQRAFLAAGKSSGKDNEDWRGSITKKELLRYQDRVERIWEEMDAMNLDEMKTTVLHNHILPLSRPGTPFSDAGHSVTSALAYAKMEDLTAVITAIILYCLPILSRLSKLLNAWSMRLTVLDRIPELLLALTDVETALKAGWDAITPPEESDDETGVTELSKATFDVMRQTLQPKVEHVCKLMDFMLDALEATPDTVPDQWIDRVDKVEQSWREWVVAGDHRIRGGEWSRPPKPAIEIPEQSPKLTIQVEAPSPKRDRILFDEDDDFSSSPSLPSDDSPTTRVFPVQLDQTDAGVEPDRQATTLASPIRLPKRRESLPKNGKAALISSRAPSEDANVHNAGRPHLDGATESKSNAKAQPSSAGRTKGSKVQMLMQKFGGDNQSGAQQKDARPNNVIPSEFNRNVVRAIPSDASKPHTGSPKAVEEDSDSELHSLEYDSSPLEGSFMEPSILETVEEEETNSEPDLPPERVPRRMASTVSVASTVIHDTSRLTEADANDPFREDSADFELPPLADPDEPFSGDDVSPPSSPPLRYQRTTSVSFHETPETLLPSREDRSSLSYTQETPQTMPSREDRSSLSVSQGPAQSLPSREDRSSLSYTQGTPQTLPGREDRSSLSSTQEYFNSSGVYDLEPPEFDSQLGSPSRMSMVSMTSEEDHLHQQIREVLQNIPAKIKLTKSSKPPINLNPPDLQLPGKPRTRPSDSMRRSTSALSSRAGTPSTYSRSGTPSFMLAPARESRQRSKSSQEIKTYHLSRSTGEAPIKLFIRSVGENGERVMVRVGGGWSDLGEYLKEYAAHHGRKSKGEGKVEVRDSPQPTGSSRLGSSPSSRPTSAMEMPSTPLAVRKTRRSMGEVEARRSLRTPISRQATKSPSPDFESSRISTRSEFDEENSSLGLAGPKPARKEMSDESRAWVESVKEKVRLASGERIPTQRSASGSLGTLDKVGGTTRLYRKK